MLNIITKDSKPLGARYNKETKCVNSNARKQKLAKSRRFRLRRGWSLSNYKITPLVVVIFIDLNLDTKFWGDFFFHEI